MALREQLADKTDWVAVSRSTGAVVPPPLRLVDSGNRAPWTAQSAAGYLFAKRLIDFTVALALLVLFAPLLVAVALAIRLDSSGTAVFRQWRTGLHGTPFRIWKFRTLTVVEDGETIAQVTKADPRVTRIGRFLRRTSVDELPQLINVLRGEMSLVGPRPHACAHDRYYAARIDNYALRQAVKPGLTGWAQVNGLRGETATVEEMRRRIGFDLWYVRQARFVLDLRIVLATPGVVLFSGNAW